MFLCLFSFKGHIENFTFDDSKTEVTSIALSFYSGLFAYNGWLVYKHCEVVFFSSIYLFDNFILFFDYAVKATFFKLSACLYSNILYLLPIKKYRVRMPHASWCIIEYYHYRILKVIEKSDQTFKSTV